MAPQHFKGKVTLDAKRVTESLNTNNVGIKIAKSQEAAVHTISPY